MRILVIEHSHIGHRFPHLRMLLPALCELSEQVTLAIPKDSVDTDEYRSQIAPLQDRVDIDAWLPTHDRWSTWHKPAEVRKAVHRSRADYVYVPHADGYAQVVGLRRLLCLPTMPRGVEVEGLVMRGAFAYPQSGRKASIKAAISMWLTMHGSWDRLHLMDPLVYNKIKMRHGAFEHRLSLMPDPMPPAQNIAREDARRRLGIPESGQYAVSVGALDSRKGTDLILHAFRQARLTDDTRLLLAGRLAPDMRELVSKEFSNLVNAGCIILLDRFLSDEEFDLAIAAADVICTPYRRHIGSASIAIRGAAAKRFVLASDYGWLGHIVPQFGLGRVCNTESINEFASELTVALDDAPYHMWGELAQLFVAFNSERNFTAAWTERLRGRLGKPGDHLKITWEEVMSSVLE